jgi:hypothetical protein
MFKKKSLVESTDNSYFLEDKIVSQLANNSNVPDD